LKDFTIQASVHVEVDNDVKGALMRLKPEVALYVGGMGHRTKNFHNDIMVRRGFGDAAKRIQELYLAGHKAEATATVPDEWVDLKSRSAQRRASASATAPGRTAGWIRSACDRASPKPSR
jgi:hypothetical protein